MASLIATPGLSSRGAHVLAKTFSKRIHIQSAGEFTADLTYKFTVADLMARTDKNTTEKLIVDITVKLFYKFLSDRPV